MNTPRYGWYGDDFTGATDTLATLAQAGLNSLLYLRVPTPEQQAAVGPLDAVGIAGIARALAPDAMREQLAPAARFFEQLGVRIMHYKCCSTFDSAPHVGNIGAAASILRPHFANPLLAIIGGQPSLGRYCLFSNLFAAVEAGGAVERIDRHPTMMRHPVTPMNEADLRLHLGLQGLVAAAIHYPAYAREKLGDLIDRELDGRTATVLFDVADPDDLVLIGAELWRRAQATPMLCIGASSVAQAMIAAWTTQGGSASAPKPQAGLTAAEGPVFVMAGSLSPVTQHQIELAKPHYHVIAGDGSRLAGDEAYRDSLRQRVTTELRRGRHVLLSTAPNKIDGIDRALSKQIAEHAAQFVADLLQQLPLRRVGIAGGDTSSHAIHALPAWGLSYRAAISPGVALSTIRSDHAWLDGTEIMLKGGQMGPPDVFQKLALT